jgi:isoleucyl-tRNA synthetase
VINEGSLTVALDTEITEELALEGFARDLVRGAQNLRKESGLEVSDRIRLYISCGERLKRALDAHSAYISGETLAVETSYIGQGGGASGGADWTPIEAGGETWTVRIEKA